MKKIALVAMERLADSAPPIPCRIQLLRFLIWHMTGIAVVIPVSSSCSIGVKLIVDPKHLKFTFPVVSYMCV